MMTHAVDFFMCEYIKTFLPLVSRSSSLLSATYVNVLEIACRHWEKTQNNRLREKRIAEHHKFHNHWKKTPHHSNNGIVNV